MIINEINNFDIDMNSINVESCFQSCTSLSEIDFSSFDMTNVDGMIPFSEMNYEQILYCYNHNLVVEISQNSAMTLKMDKFYGILNKKNNPKFFKLK